MWCIPVKKVGWPDGIFRRYLNAVTPVPALRAQPLLTRSILDALLTQVDIKRAATLAVLTAGLFLASEDEVRGILDVLVARYLVRRSVRDGIPWFEQIHERLVPFVKEWLGHDPEFLKFRLARDLITNAKFWRMRPEILLNRVQVEGMIGPFRDRLRLDTVQAEFVYLGAVVSQSDEAAFWADRYDREAAASPRDAGPSGGPAWSPSVDLLLEALREDRRELRLGAAAVAHLLPDPDGRLAEAFGSFNREPDEEIRRAAARSYARLIARDG
jgi:hypothetical protein